MALFIMILRKMVKNKWLELSLLFGLILSVALVSSMPIYTNAILQRMLLKDLENLQHDSGQYPGVFWSYAHRPIELEGEKGTTTFPETDLFLQRYAQHQFGMPLQYFVRERATSKFSFVPVDDRVDATKKRLADIVALDGMEDHIRLIDGRLPAKEPVDGVYEALVVPDAMTYLHLVVGNEFVLDNRDLELEEPIRVRVVGVFDRKEYDDVFWYNYLSTFSNSFLIPFELFEQDFTVGQKLNTSTSYWYFALDYTKVSLSSMRDYINTSYMIESYLYNNYDTYSTKAPPLMTMAQYFTKEEKLRVMLWSLNVPVMLMLAFYLYMVSNLIVERQKTEIAVLRSRGASRWQIVVSYALEGLVLGVIAFLIGPYLGMFLTKILGAANGFLEFVQRAKLDVSLNEEAFKYSLIAVATSLVMTLFPVILATRATIVGHKQQMARMRKSSFWHKFFIDIVLIGVSWYGLTNFRTRMNDMMALGLASGDMRIDPLLFLVPALFILGLGLFILRIYPWMVRLIYWIGKRWWPPSLYSTLIQVGRSTTQYQFIMVFLIITIATGMFSASAARTINRNMEDKVMYNNGADIVLQTFWENDAPPFLSFGDGEEDNPTPAPIRPQKTQYSEPPYLQFLQLPGVEHAAKVFTKKETTIAVGKDKGTTLLMGIETDEFGRASWLRDRLLDHHFYEYLNLIASDPSAVLISRSLANEFNLRPGDYIDLNWTGVNSAQFIVYGVIDYWPSWNPNPITPSNSSGKMKYPHLVVSHLSYIQNNLALEPYDVWLKLSEDATSQELYAAIEDRDIPVRSVIDSRQELIRAKNDPFQLAINGVMTLGFVISISISFFGFLLYWILSLSARTLQFGILRAMGVSFSQLIAMIVGEQILTSGAALLIGVTTGAYASKMFVPMFQLSFDPNTQVPPFEVMFDPNDQMQLFFIVTTMMVLGLFILGYMMSRIKIHQAVKLGED